MSDVGKAVHSAFSRIGFVSLTNHGIDESAAAEVFAASKRFFEMSTEVKLSCPQSEDKTQVRPFIYSAEAALLWVQMQILFDRVMCLRARKCWTI